MSLNKRSHVPSSLSIEELNKEAKQARIGLISSESDNDCVKPKDDQKW